MTATPLREDYNERLGEVDAYLIIVTGIEHALNEGTPFLRGAAGAMIPVTPLQQRLLYAGVYLHLYNLVEATISRCVAAVERAATAGGTRQVGDLSRSLRAEWVKSTAKTAEALGPDVRLEAAVALCESLVAMLPITLSIRQGGGGNWDDVQIKRFCERIGVSLQLQPATFSAVKRPFRDDQGPIKTIVTLRNKLAHGVMSFSECGSGVSSTRLQELRDLTASYLSEVVDAFERFIDGQEYLEPARRSPPNAA